MNMSHLDLITAWQHLYMSLGDMIEAEPILLPLVRRWASSIVVPPQSNPLQKIFRTSQGQDDHQIGEQGNGEIVGNRTNDIQACDALFVPGFPRINCVGVSQSVAHALWQMQPNLKIGMIPPDGLEEANLPRLDNRFVLYKLVEKKTPSLRFFYTAWQLARQVKKYLQGDPLLSAWWRKSEYLRLLEIARFQENRQRAKILLQQMNCRLVVCLNEQLWPGSVFVPAAKELEIPTVQILHGTPTRLYWPFISDEIWIWDHSTQAMFEGYGTPPSRLYTTGNLESSFWLTEYDVPESTPKKKTGGLLTCLFLSQWAGSEIWGVAGFDEPVYWLADALSEQNVRWQVVVRLHPYDGPEARVAMQKTLSFLGDRLTFSDKLTPLIEDILEADIVCTGSSTAVLMALAYNKPGLLLWSSAMEYVHGRPFLDEANVVYSGQALSQIMKNGVHSFGKVNSTSICKDTNQVAARRVMKLLKRE